MNPDLLNILGDVACVQDDFSYSRGEGLTIISGDQQLEKNHGSDCKKMVENVDSCAKIFLNANGGAHSDHSDSTLVSHMSYYPIDVLHHSLSGLYVLIRDSMILRLSTSPVECILLSFEYHKFTLFSDLSHSLEPNCKSAAI